MSEHAYQTFIDQLCEHIGITPSAPLYSMAELAVNETRFLLRHGGPHAPQVVKIYCSLGSPPKSRREAIFQRLLETNLAIFGTPGSPSLSYNADTGEVLLACGLLLHESSAIHALGVMSGLANVASDWRVDYFLDEPALARAAGSAGLHHHGMPRHLNQALAGLNQSR